MCTSPLSAERCYATETGSAGRSSIRLRPHAGPIVWGRKPLEPGFLRHLLKCSKAGSCGARGRRQKLLASKDLPKRAVRPILSEG